MSEENNVTTAEAVEKKVNPVVDGLCKALAFLGITTKLYRGSKHNGKIVVDIFDYIILSIVGIAMLYPFWWMICASFAGTQIDMAKTIIWPQNPVWAREGEGFFFNYASFLNLVPKVAQGISFWRVILNTLLYSIVPVVVGVLTSASAAFAFAKIEWKARGFVFFFLLAAIMVPWPTIMCVQYCFFNILGWTDNGLSQWIPGMFGSIMTAFFIRQFLFGLPTSIVEAAKIDGAGYWRIFWQFIVPLAMPAIMAQGILSFMGAWNNYLGCFIMVDNLKWYNLPCMINKINTYQRSGQANGAVTIAASVVSIIPVLILFAAFQKQIIGSLMLTGSKE